MIRLDFLVRSESGVESLDSVQWDAAPSIGDVIYRSGTNYVVAGRRWALQPTSYPAVEIYLSEIKDPEIEEETEDAREDD